MANAISAVILTRDSERLLPQVLGALARLDEVVLLDNGSQDKTFAIAKEFANVVVHEHPFIGFGKMKQLGARLAKNDWILSIDSDEIASDLLIDELLTLPLDPQILYEYDVHNFYRGKRIRCCGWGHDRFAGVYHRQYADFDSSAVHEKVIMHNGSRPQIHALKGFISHYPFENAESFLIKIKKYSALYAKQNKDRKSSSPCKALLRSMWAFVRSYVLQRGFLCGYEGFIISAYNAQSVFWKYILLYEQQSTMLQS